MSLKALSDYTFQSRYSKYLPEKGRRETWSEAVKRVFDMHRVKYSKQIAENKELDSLIEFAEQQVQKKRVLAAQRTLQFAGEPIFKHELRLYNCLAVHINRERAFQEIMYALLCGCGVGFSVQKHHIARISEVVKPTKGTKKFVVEDSIEGWADAVGVLMNSYFSNPVEFINYHGYVVEFDYSLVRPEGALIAGQFKAPGPKGLEASLEKIRKLLNGLLDNTEGVFKLHPIHCYDIIMHISDAVLSGGVRRSATLSLFSSDDEEMRNAKTGNWFVTNPQRARSNNSAALLKGKTTRESFHELMQSTKEFGEPGFIWVDDLETIYNPCCVPGYVTVECKGKGIITLDQLLEGDEIWSIEGWTKVLKKWSNGVKDVYAYETKSGNFYSTDDHKVQEFGETREVKDAGYIDFFDKRTECLPSKIEFRNYVGLEEVFDIMVDNNSHTFWCNGFNIHNCEIGMIPTTEDGRSGFQSCNLTEINGKWCDSEENFLSACKAASIIGTLQAGYTNLKYLSKESKEIFEREALLGCSITGMMDNPEILFDPEIQKKGAKEILKVNELVAGMIGINPSARATAIKPGGSTSCVLGTASGVHPHHSRKYIRRVQANKTEFCLQEVEKHNPIAVEESVWSANKTDKVISFLCEVPPGAIVKNHLSAIELLEKVIMTQKNWVEYGTRESRCVNKKLRHNVSNTIQVKPNEWDEVEKFIFDNQKWIAGISLLPASGDLDYAQAPFSTVLTPSELVKEYGDASIFASGLIVDGLHAFDNNLWKACDTVMGNGENISNFVELPEYPVKRTNKTLADYFNQKEVYDEWFAKNDWIRRVNQFAERYFAGDIRKATYCMKHVSLWKTWCDLKREYKEIDWAEVKEERHDFVSVDTLGAQACAGGQCEIRL